MTVDIRITRLLAVACAVFAWVLTPAVFAVEVGGVKFNETAKVANQDLKLNGAGIRYKVIFKVYAMGLYLKDKKTTPAEILAAPGAKRIQLVMMRDVSSNEFGEAFMAGIRKNSGKAEKAKLINQFLKFGELFASVPELKKGDVLMNDWIPGSGTHITLNGKVISDVIPDVAFYNVLLKIWLGEYPADAKLKKALLGESEETPRPPVNY